MPTSKSPAARETRKDDPRSLRSRSLLQGALLRLIEERPLDRITLREITQEAGLSYPTVFNHYAGKEALFQDIALGEIEDLLGAFRQGRTTPNWRPGRDICAYILPRRALWRTLLTTGANAAMRSEFIRRGRELPRSADDLPHGFAIDLVSAVIASGIFEIVAWWLGAEDDHPTETVADMLETLVIEPGLGLARGYFTGR